MPNPEEEGGDGENLLTFRREGKAWRLIVESGVPGEPETWESNLAINTSREIRMDVAGLLPELIEKLVQTAIRRRDEVREKTESVRAVRGVIKQVRGGRGE